MKVVVVLAMACCLAASRCYAQDQGSARLDNWHQWRGPNADGVAPHGDPPLAWDESTNVKWKAAIPGTGSGTPVVWGDRIFLLTAIDTERAPDVAPVRPPRPAADSGPAGGFGGGRRGAPAEPAPKTVHKFDVLCLDRATGAVVWQKTAVEDVPHEGRHATNTFASASAATDGRLVIASFGSRGLFCYDVDGNFKWKKDLGDMQTRRGFGEGSSPTLYGDRLIVPWDQETGSFIVCLDAETGEEIWRQERDEVTTWNTPRVIEHGGVVQVIVNATNRTRAYDLADGKVLWECGGQATNPIASPVVRNGVVYCMTGHHGYAVYAIPLDSRGDVTGGDKIKWSRTDMGPYVSSPLLYDDQLYFVKGDQGILCSLNADTGEPIYPPKRLNLGQTYASPVGAAGRVYVTDRAGTTIVLEHGPQFNVLQENRIDETVNASLAIVGKEIFLRGDKHLYCIAEE
jgi:outer membrane protein assembly factor BamB